MKNKQIKSDLALAYRIISYLEMDDLTYTHISLRSEEGDSFYIAPFGKLFSEVTKDNLIKVSFSKEVLEGEEKIYNPTGYAIHSSIYCSRPEINSIFHLHTKAGVAVSSMKFGLLPMSQFALHLYDNVSYHDYNSLVLQKNSGNLLAEDLEQNYALFLRNHGTLTVGKTIQEAMFFTYHLEQACKVQIASLAAGIDNVIIPSKEICEKSKLDLLSFEKDLGIRDWKAFKRLLSLEISK